jgi:AraC family transcriptional regulator
MMYLSEKGVLNNSELFFHTPSNLSKSIFFYLIQLGDYTCDKNYYVERDNFNSYLLMYVKSGTGIVKSKAETFYVKENDVVLLNCHEHHAYFTETGWEIEWLHFDGNVSKEYYDLITMHCGCVIPIGESNLIPRTIKSILNLFRYSKQILEPIVSCHIQRMLAELIIIVRSSKGENLDKANPIGKAVEYIEANFKEKLSVKTVATFVNLSVYHFSRLFKKETGYSPYEYILKTRLDNAKILLKNSSLSIKEVAFNTGFNSESGFVTSFHQNVKMTPREFRETLF